MKFGTWVVKSLNRACSLTAAHRELASRLCGCKGGYVRFGGTEAAQQEQGIITFSMEKETTIINSEQEFLYTTE